VFHLGSRAVTTPGVLTRVIKPSTSSHSPMAKVLDPNLGWDTRTPVSSSSSSVHGFCNPLPMISVGLVINNLLTGMTSPRGDAGSHECQMPLFFPPPRAPIQNSEVGLDSGR